MFMPLGRTVARAWPLLLLAWVAVLVTCVLIAPPWEQVTRHGEAVFLPDRSPSRLAETLFSQAFPGPRQRSSIVLVVHRADRPLDEQDKRFIADDLRPQLERLRDEKAFRPLITDVLAFDNPGTGRLLVSADRMASLVVVELTTSILDRRNWALVGAIEADVGRLVSGGKEPAGLDIAVTGSATLGRDETRAQLRSANATHTWTLALVIILLLVIYRSPLLAAIPLATVFVAVELSLRLLAMMAAAGWVTLFEGAQIYATVLGYGAGVDYCLFLTARCREGLDEGDGECQAVANAVGNVGAALTASAATVICGTGMMAFASFGKFHEAGIIIPFSLFIVLLAALTFAPALLCLFGRWAFWPRKLGARPVEDHVQRRRRANPFRDVWEQVGRALLRRPGTIWLCTVLVMAPFAILAVQPWNRPSYDLIGGIPNGPGVEGLQVLRAHFPLGMVGPTTILIRNDGIDFREKAGEDAIAALTDRLRRHQDALGIADIRSIAAPLGIRADVRDYLAELPQAIVRQQALNRYVSHSAELDSHVTRLDIVPTGNPFISAATAQLDQLEDTLRADLPAALREGTELEALGPAASLRDLRNVTTADQWRIEILVPSAVFVILVLLLRQVLVSLYLIVSVLFSYLATLGVAYVFFLMLDAGFTGLDWRVPIFLFTILVAVGEDYNIFLMSRIHEEQRSRGRLRGIVAALATTGGVISSCGIIMAGTFGSLTAGSVAELKQLGFALSFGVLLDTLIVRPILVPAFLVLLEKRVMRKYRV